MKIIVCGGRDFIDHEYMNKKLSEFHARSDIRVLIHGDARGADRIAAMWAHKQKTIFVSPFPADWNTYGNSAGPVRNALMLEENPDAVIAFPGGVGTKNMMYIARKAGIRVIEYDPNIRGGLPLDD